MLPLITAIVLLAILLGIAGAWLSRQWAEQRRERHLADARAEFMLRREWLEAKFVQMASASGSPRGLRWADCDFDNHVSFARDRRTGQLASLVGVAIKFEAIEGGGMEDVEAVAHRKAATAIFRYDGTQWRTDGRAIFNLNPSEAIEFYQSELETAD